MELSLPQWGQLLTLLMIAMALGMDAFSLGIGMGMHQPSSRKIACLSGSIGIFHIFMPLIGIVIGQYLSVMMKDITAMVGGGMLCLLGFNMLWNVYKARGEESGIQVNFSIWGLLMFSLSVSMDSLSAGLSLGLFSTDIWIAVALFGLMGALMAGSGLYLGRFVGHWLGRYGEVVGGIILLTLGSKFLW
ncbi:manganese efflux pump MntP family protein [Hazenella coriacea]|uniref:Putative manganese efflux pump MntP n=1 Tax=Hazenella coriacea TaxID=1179467 RepID=A0A4R3L7E0_9BACL|nr:manganese efflux pump MntP family protein [Hazenella coriacea]TCS95579.1 putative Mn2+ efflux pump MntP [Hazenella coriacea]